jgi:hypothetical protein
LQALTVSITLVRAGETRSFLTEWQGEPILAFPHAMRTLQN